MFFGFVDYAYGIINYVITDPFIYTDINRAADIGAAGVIFDGVKNAIQAAALPFTACALLPEIEPAKGTTDLTNIKEWFELIKAEKDRIKPPADIAQLEARAQAALGPGPFPYNEATRPPARNALFELNKAKQLEDTYKQSHDLQPYANIEQIVQNINELTPFIDITSPNALVVYYKAFNLYNTYDKNDKIGEIKTSITEISQINNTINIPGRANNGKLEISYALDQPPAGGGPLQRAQNIDNIDNYYIAIKMYELYMVQMMMTMVCMLPCIVFGYLKTTISDDDSKKYHKEIDDFIVFLLRKITLYANPPYDLLYYNEVNNDMELERRSIIDTENHTIIKQLNPLDPDDTKIKILDEMIDQEEMLLKKYDTQYVRIDKKELQYLYDNPIVEPKKIPNPANPPIPNPRNPANPPIPIPPIPLIPNPNSILNKKDMPSLIYQFIYKLIKPVYTFVLPDTEGMNEVDKRIALIAKYKLHYVYKYEAYLAQEYVQYNLLEKLLKEHTEEKNYSMISRFLLSS